MLPTLGTQAQTNIFYKLKVLIPSEAIWEPNAAFATDFNIEMARMSVEQCKLNVQITAQDEEGGDTPLNISQHVHVKWQPNYKAGSLQRPL